MNNGHLLGYIPDGYTKPFYIAERPRLYPAVSGHCRPLGAVDQSVAHSQVTRLENDPRKQQEVIAAIIRRQLVDWDLRDEEGGIAPLEESILIRMQPLLCIRLYSIVMGTDGGDSPPDATDAEDGLEASVLLERALAGEPGASAAGN